MSSNSAVAYIGPGKVEVRDIDYPVLELRTGRGSTRRTWAASAARRDPQDASPPTSAAPTSTWCAAAPPRRPGWCSATRSPARWSRSGPDVEFIKVGDLVLGAVQHRVRPLPQLQGGQDRHLPERQPGPARRRVRLRRHGRLGRRPGRVRAGAVRRLEPAEVPRPGPGDGEDPRPGDAVRHLPDRLPRLRHRRRATGSTVYIAGAGRSGWPPRTSALLLGAAVVIVGDLNEDRLAQAAQLRLRDRRRVQGRPEGPDRADPRRARGRLRRRRGRLRGPRPRRRGGDRAAGDRAQLADGRHPRRRRASASRGCTSPATRAPSTRPPRSDRCRIRLGLGWAKSHVVHDRPVPGHAVQPPADDGDPARPGADREGRQRHADPAGRGARGATRSSTRARPRSTCSTRTA